MPILEGHITPRPRDRWMERIERTGDEQDATKPMKKKKRDADGEGHIHIHRQQECFKVDYDDAAMVVMLRE